MGLFPMSEPEWVLPVLTWAESTAQFGVIHPDAGVYLRQHSHQHEGCGHIAGCGFPLRGEPCQAYETTDKQCDDCLLRSIDVEPFRLPCADRYLPRDLRGKRS